MMTVARAWKEGKLWLNLLAAVSCSAADTTIRDDRPLDLPPPGAHQLRLISPNVLELTLVTLKEPDPAPVAQWDFVQTNGQPRLPAATEFAVLAGGQSIPVARLGFKRRVLYAPLIVPPKGRDLRVVNCLYLQLGAPIADGRKVEVKNPSGKLWTPARQFVVQADPLRFSPAIHVNHLGYLPGQAKVGMVGYYLGSLGELLITAGPEPATSQSTFQLLDAASNRPVYEGRLARRPDEDFPFPGYANVFEANFSEFKQPGEYRLRVPGLGVSYPFWIGDQVAAAWARTYALGLYHQRCGAANELPFTRFTHGPCHCAPAEVPTEALENASFFLAQSTADATNKPGPSPPLKTFSASLYPCVKHGKIEVAGGHHDAGDYSKYTINSAGLIHFLVFAADVFPGVADLDNLGLPESGDGKSDVLQTAKWEADFLARLQDTDGGFYFLVYPRDRRYENNVLPDQGDPQIVWPKNTSATAAAVAALAQCASSPRFKQQFPDAAARYLDQAKKGWAFLDRAIAKYGKEGAYQKLTHYGHEFGHDDELAWAACELYLATGDQVYHRKLVEWFDPANPNTRRWGWLRLVGSYGCAVRSYALAVKAGKARPNQLDLRYLAKCENELIAGAQDQLQRARDSAYGTSFPLETKRTATAGWYFSGDAAFDLATACQLDFPRMNDPRPKFHEALLSNLNYEAGCNPVNIAYVTGLGWKRPREIVHQYAQNDRRVLPPGGISIGNIQGGFMWLDPYKRELGGLSFPPDGDTPAPYPFYDRWSDSFNVSTEFVVLNTGRALATTAWLLAQTPLKNQSSKPVAAQITVQPGDRKNPAASPTATLSAPGADLRQARIVWEAQDQEPAFGSTVALTPATTGPRWVEVEALLADGRFVFAATNYLAK